MKPPFENACPTLPLAGAQSPLATPRLRTGSSKTNQKPKIAIFSLTSCEGCSLSILELEDQLLDILGVVEIVNFREGMTERAWDIDIGFVDGAVSTTHDEEALKCFRESCKTLVAIGACACLGGINTLKNYQSNEEYRKYVYAGKAISFPSQEARPLSALVKVDYELPGCPMVREEFLRFVKFILAGRTFRLPNYPVCVECKKSGNICLYSLGEHCLGPITRAGCNAICPHYGSRCEACRGIISEDALKAFALNMRERYGVASEEVLSHVRMYGAYQKETLP